MSEQSNEGQFQPESQAEVRRKMCDWYRFMAKPLVKKIEVVDTKKEDTNEDSTV
jgi:uncharacterized protein YnzC (UPF0291/DUF896 family)